MRLFVAVDVPETIKQVIEEDIVDVLRDVLPGARWTRPEGRHLTLKFLGNVADDRLGEIISATGSVARRHASFTTSFVEIGGFPTVRRPRVLWVGVGEGGEAMGAVADDLERTFEPLGFEPEGRPFHGHFTLARFPRPRVIEKLAVVRIPEEPFDVGEIVLFESKLHPKGARYSVVERFPLGGGP